MDLVHIQPSAPHNSIVPDLDDVVLLMKPITDGSLTQLKIDARKPSHALYCRLSTI